MSTLLQWTQDALAVLTPTAIYADAKQDDEEEDDSEKVEADSDEKSQKSDGKEEGGDDNDGGEENGNAGEEEEEEEEDEPEDIRPQLEEQCTDGPCSKAKHHFEQCADRVASQPEGHEHPKEDCVEEFFHLKHCVDTCTAPKLFAQLK